MGAVLGIDLGGTTINWVVLGGRGHARAVIAKGAVPTASIRTAILAQLTEIARRADRVHELQAWGVGVPGHVDRESGIVRLLPNLSGEWAGFPLGRTLANAINQATYLLNDARAFSLAEYTLGAAQGRRSALFLTLGTGVGGGIVVNGQLLVGADDRVGEIGHLTYERDGRPCRCGGHGCLEAYASGPALVEAVQELGGSRPDSAADVIAHAEQGDRIARAVIEQAGHAIGETVAGLCAVLPTDVLVIGGGVSGGLPQLRPHIERALALRRSFIGPVEVVPAQLGTVAGAVGAALAAEQTRQNPARTGGDRELDRASA